MRIQILEVVVEDCSNRLQNIIIFHNFIFTCWLSRRTCSPPVKSMNTWLIPPLVIRLLSGISHVPSVISPTPPLPIPRDDRGSSFCPPHSVDLKVIEPEISRTTEWQTNKLETLLILNYMKHSHAHWESLIGFDSNLN